MRKKDLDLLWMFTLRIGMYTGKENQDTISAFLHGYEIGRGNDCHFIEQLTTSIEEDFNIECRSSGWVGQIENVAQKLETEWVVVFKKQSLKVLVKEFDDPTKIIFEDSIRKRVNGKMNGIANYFNKSWITDWFGIIDLSANWFKRIWSKEELLLIMKIEAELKLYGKIRSILKEVQPTVKLKNICEELLQKLEQ